MASELLDFNSTTYKQAAGTDGINDWMEVNSSPPVEVFRVTSDESDDWFFCRKISRVKSVLIQNHGATFGTGVRDNPQITISQGSGVSGTAKITITHTDTQEVFSVIIIGEL